MCLKFSLPTLKILSPPARIGNINRNNCCFTCFRIFRDHHMKRTLALKSQDQAPRLRHFCGVVFNGFTGGECLRKVARGNPAFEHTLNSMHAEDDFVCIHVDSFTLEIPFYKVHNTCPDLPTTWNVFPAR
jgi:hypothetical protein